MYKNDYVMCLIKDGHILEEVDRKVRLPFGAEYKVRLKNKHSKRCAVDLIINGEKVSRFILDSNETTDIERFLDGNLSSGKRFQFASLHDGRVKDKQNFENGLVEAHFFQEEEPQIREIHHHHDHWDRKPYVPLPDPYPPYPEHPWPGYPTPYCEDMNKIIQRKASTGGGTCSRLQVGDNNYAMPGEGMTFSMNCSADLPGSTVRGSESKQEFREVSGYTFSSTSTILKLKIVNGEVRSTTRYCSGCGRKRKHGNKYCSNCGTQY